MDSGKLCVCAIAKTQKYIQDHDNKCPTCNKTLIEKDNLETMLRKVLLSGPGSGFSDGKSQEKGMRLKPPTYSGRDDPKHFFVKLKNYLETYHIDDNKEIIRVLKSCLDGKALDLYLTLNPYEQGELESLQKMFKNHFQPMSHSIVETENFMRTKKRANESVSEYFAGLKKKADELKIESALLKVAFVSGLSKETQRHCILQKADTLEEYLKEAQEFEKIAKLGNAQASVTMSTFDETQNEEQTKLDTVIKLLNNQKITQSQTQSQRGINNANDTNFGDRSNSVNFSQSGNGYNNNFEKNNGNSNRFHKKSGNFQRNQNPNGYRNNSGGFGNNFNQQSNRDSRFNYGNQMQNQYGYNNRQKCNWCTGHKHDKQECPAKDAICAHCGRLGHWSSACFKKNDNNGYGNFNNRPSNRNFYNGNNRINRNNQTQGQRQANPPMQPPPYHSHFGSNTQAGYSTTNLDGPQPNYGAGNQ